ncbi:glycosyltransferase family 39 protein [Candidatus Woesebacteria bacterium]|nr:glycosyltransferase family 39 protein [Candidatus Woesebacteria bacterium]
MPQIKLSPQLEKVLILLLLLLVSVGLIWQVISLSHFVPLHDWDEAIYAQVAKEWLKSPSLTLHYNGVVWFEKPPVPFVLMGGLMALFGTSILPLRILSAVLGILTLVSVYSIAKRITKQSMVGLVAATVLLSSNFFLDRSSLINVDMYLTLSWLLYVVSEKLGLRLLAIVLGVGSKSLLGFIPLLVDLCYELFSRTLTLRKIRDYSIQMVVGSIWYVVMFAKFGSVFVQSHFLDHMISRITRPIELHFGDRFFYIIQIGNDLGVWSVIALIGGILLAVYVFRSFLQHKEGQNASMRKLVSLTIALPLVYLALLTVGKSKLTWYTIPVIPFLAIWASLTIHKIQKLHKYLVFLPILIVAINLSVFGIRTISEDFQKYQVPDKTNLALCINTIEKGGGEPLVYLVSSQERTDAQVIEAAKLQIGSSFIYGSAPAFVYYVNQPVSFYYSSDKMKTDALAQKVLVVHEADLADPQILRIARTWNTNSVAPVCVSGPWQAFARDY